MKRRGDVLSHLHMCHLRDTGASVILCATDMRTMQVAPTATLNAMQLRHRRSNRNSFMKQ